MKSPAMAARGLILLLAVPALPLRAAEPLIVVENRGGTSALPYYEALNLLPRSPAAEYPTIATPAAPATTVSEADMLPVRSPKLTPGKVAPRTIEAPGLRPLILIGDDETSRTWLRQHTASLRERGAMGLVVNVETAAGLEWLRQIAPDLRLWPVPADDLANRLDVRHYPVLISSTSIEQ